VSHVRENIVLSEFDWVEKSWDIYAPYGFRFVCNLNWQAGPNSYPNLDAYKSAITKVMQSNYKADVWVMQNEELNPNFNKFTASEYATMLRTASPIIKQYGGKMTNGGIYGSSLYQLTYRFVKSVYGQSAADTFGKLCMTKAQMKAANNPGSNSIQEAGIKDMLTVINAVKETCDYINVHFYIDPNPDGLIGVTDYSVFPTIQEYLRSYTGLETITNETCVRNSKDAQLVTDTMAMYADAEIPYCLYFSGDSDMAGAVSLFEPDKSIRPGGIAFQNFVKSNV